MRDGLYKVAFKTPLGEGAGVVVIAGPTLQGGDSMMSYVGMIDRKDDAFTADIGVTVHTQVQGMQSVFGVNDANIHLKGSFNDNVAVCKGSSPQARGVAFQATLTRLS